MLNSLGNAQACSRDRLDSFCFSWGAFGVSLGHLGQSWGALWATWDCIGASWERLGIALGRPWNCSGPHWEKSVRQDTHRKPMALSSTAPAHKNRPAGICPPVPPVTAKRSTNCRSGPTFHTRWDQDDASFTNSLKLKSGLSSILLNSGYAP